MSYFKAFISRTIGANAEIEALKKAVALAENKAAAEQALCKKHEARVVEAERELQEAVGRSESLEQSLSLKESNSPKLFGPRMRLERKPRLL